MNRFADFQARYLAGELTAADFEGMTPEDSVKARMEAAVLHRSGAGEVQRAKSDGKRSHHFVLSSERGCGPYCDVVRHTAWELDDYVKQGSTLLWAHDGSQPPLGKVEKLAKLKTRKTLEGVVRFMDEGIYPFADLIARMVENDIITNGSVGFTIDEARPPSEDEIKKERLTKHSMIIERATLKEFSIVPVGADPNAIKMRGDEIRSALDEMVERGETEKDVASHFAELLGIYEPLATRSIIVPEFSWKRSGAQQEPGSEGASFNFKVLGNIPATVEWEPDGDGEVIGRIVHQANTITATGGSPEEPEQLPGDDFSERIEALAKSIEDFAETRTDQASTIEDLTLRLQEAEATIERLEKANEKAAQRMNELSEAVYIAGGPLNIKPQERTSSVPVYADLLFGIHDLDE